jgi:tetratricopeptide (TPR) repeat protein
VSLRVLVSAGMLLVGSALCSAQTFEVGSHNDAKNTSGATGAKAKKEQAPADQQLGWGSGLEVAQQARAAQAALAAGDYAAAMSHAERAAKAAPQNADLWFLFGYAARLSGHYQTSVDAFQHGLSVRPGSIPGLAGLAQTYAKMGRNEDAKKLLLQVIAARPNSPSDLQLAGELFLSSDPQQALELMKRAEALDSSPRTELLMARAYQTLKRPEEAKQYLERARRRAPRDPSVLRTVAAFYRENRQYDLALSTLRQVTSKTPDYWAELGYTYQLSGKRGDAAEAFVRAANGAKGEIGYQLSAAEALLNVGKLQPAAELLGRAQALDSDHYRLHAIRGQMASLQDRPDDAIKEYQAAIAHLPEAVPEGALYPIELHLNLAELYQASDNSAASSEQIGLAAAQLKNIQAGQTEKPEYLRLRSIIESNSNDQAAAEKDLQEALNLEPGNLAIILNYGNLLWKMHRQDESLKMFHHALDLDPQNRSALTSLGFLSRDTDNPKAAEEFFLRLAKLYPNDYVPYMALGDLYTSEKLIPRALANYQKAYQLSPKRSLVVARGVNAAIEGHDLILAKTWLDRADERMNGDPQVMRERERYLTLTGKYRESADLGYKVLEKLPNDAEAPVYLGYDLVFLGQYKEALDLFNRYEPILPKDKDLWLIAGHSHIALGDKNQALTDFTEALKRDPNMATGYMNRGYVLNDLRQAEAASKDFQVAIKLHPGYGEAYLGLAMAHLQLHRASKAMGEVNTAEKILGPSRVTHMTRAEAFRQQMRFPDAEKEYRAALIFAPNDPDVELALAETLYRLRRYQEAVDLLQQVASAKPDDAVVYARLAQIYAQMGNQQETEHNAEQAEQLAVKSTGKEQSEIFLTTGEAFLTLGRQDAAMQRFSRALDAPDGDVIETRLAIARLFMRQGREEDAREQVALGFAEARVSGNAPIQSEHLVEAADIFLSTHQYELAMLYLQRALAAGAVQDVVAVRMTNAYLAQGKTKSAEAQLATVSADNGPTQNYDYLMAQANVYRQRQENVPALIAFARASESAGNDEAAQQAQYELAAAEGRQVNDTVSLSSKASFSPIFEDINIYALNAKLLNLSSQQQLPPPRSSYESLGLEDYHLHFSGLPTVNGFVGERNARGTISIPSSDTVLQRNTFDTLFNAGIAPTVNLGGASLFFNTGVQFTVRRDTASPFDMNQNLFRQFLYMTTNPLMNWLTISGTAMREAGPFTEQNLHSRDAAASLNFRVGRPWGKTALITGYDVRDVLFRPLIREYYTTDMYVGIERRIGTRFRFSVLGDYERAWKVQDNNWAIAQAIRPAASFEYHKSPQWSFEGSFALSRGEGFHTYDNAQSGFLVSYMKPLHGALREGGQEVPVAYPLRFSFGIQQQTFYNFAGHASGTFFPVIRLGFF